MTATPTCKRSAGSSTSLLINPTVFFILWERNIQKKSYLLFPSVPLHEGDSLFFSGLQAQSHLKELVMPLSCKLFSGNLLNLFIVLPSKSVFSLGISLFTHSIPFQCTLHAAYTYTLGHLASPAFKKLLSLFSSHPVLQFHFLPVSLLLSYMIYTILSCPHPFLTSCLLSFPLLISSPLSLLLSRFSSLLSSPHIQIPSALLFYQQHAPCLCF